MLWWTGSECAEAVISAIDTSNGRVWGWPAAPAGFGLGIRTDYERDCSIVEVFERRASERPGEIAVLTEEGALTYAELARQARTMAAWLGAHGVQPGACVGVGLDRSPALPSVLLGILGAGAAYVALESAYPRARLAFMIEDAGIAVIVTEAAQLRTFAGLARCLDVAAVAARTAPTELPLSRPTSLAYIAYTSGSTGVPKGVAVEHRGVTRLVRRTNYVEIAADDTVLQYAPLAFDASTFELWAPLLNGARLAIAKPGVLTLAELNRTIEQFAVTTLWLTAALFREAVEARLGAFARLRRLLAGGDVLSPAHVKRFVEAFPQCELINGYGPTENTTFSCTYSVPSPAAIDESVPIGRPIANSSAYVLDQHLAPVPFGVVGELCVGGDGVARGYLNLPELTAERFVPDPFSSEPGARLYRTGDRVRQRDDGVIEFLGRFDNQVKVRGYRIELNEIEKVLSRHPAVADACVVAKERAADRELVAYVIPSRAAAFDESALRAHLRNTLPAHMLPHRIVERRELPLNANGKVDRVALTRDEPAPPSALPLRRKGSKEVALLEVTIGEIWRELLGYGADLDTNFFDAGGDSLRLLRMHAALAKELKVDATVADLFEQSTIRKLAAFVARSQARA